MDMNMAHLMGRLGNDPVTRLTQKGTRVTTFSLATQEYIKSKNESETTWHRIVAWGQAGEFCAQYLKKGASVMVSGSMKVRKFEGEDGKPHFLHEIHTLNVKALGKRKQDAESATELDELHLQS